MKESRKEELLTKLPIQLARHADRNTNDVAENGVAQKQS
jgi:hypothetical protein